MNWQKDFVALVVKPWGGREPSEEQHLFRVG
jgi:hypothetical protein